MPRVVDTAEVRALLAEGKAQVIEVLPQSAWRREHLPGARSIPLAELWPDRLGDLDPAAPTVVYCYDHECDLSSRGAARLEALGFSDVADYAASKTAWLGAGLPFEGDVDESERAGGLARSVPTCTADATVADIEGELADDAPVVVVVDDAGVVLGAVHLAALGLPPDTAVLDAADPGPASVRPSITRLELAESMDREHQHHVLVTTSDGRLIGMVVREDLG